MDYHYGQTYLWPVTEENMIGVGSFLTSWVSGGRESGLWFYAMMHFCMFKLAAYPGVNVFMNFFNGTGISGHGGQ